MAQVRLDLLDLPAARFDLRLQVRHQLFELAARLLQMGCHPVEGLGQLPHLVPAGHGDTALQHPLPHLFGMPQQPPQRDIDQHPGHQGQGQGHQQQQAEGEPGDAAPVFGHVGLNRFQGNHDVENPEQPAAGAVDVAGPGNAGRFVVDPPGQAEDFPPLAVPVKPTAIHRRGLHQGRRGGMADGAGLGPLVDLGAGLGRVGGIGDDTVLVDQADMFHPLLGADLADHLVNPLAVVLQHLVMGRLDQRLAQKIDVAHGLFHEMGIQGVTVDQGKQAHRQQHDAADGQSVFFEQPELHRTLPHQHTDGSTLTLTKLFARTVRQQWQGTGM